MIATAVLLCVGAVAPEVEVSVPPPAAGVWVAKKRRKRGSKKTPPLAIKTALPEIRLKIKRRRATAVLVSPGESFDVAISGSGRLGILVYQAQGKGGPVTLEWSVDGASQRAVTVEGKVDKRAKVYGPATGVSKPKGASAKLAAGDHVVSMKVPGGDSRAVVELQWYPGRSKVAAPVRIEEAAPAPEPEPVAEVEPPPPDTPPPPEEVVAEPVADTPRTEVERRIAAGEIRDGVVGTYDMINVKNLTDSSSELFARTGAEQPYVIVADGPGTVTVRVHRLTSAGVALSDSESLTILENDILLQTFDLDSAVSATLEVAGVASLEVATAKEYKLSLGPRLSRFTFQPSEASSEGLAITYTFDAAEKNSAMALTMDLGDEFGLGGDLGGGTTITEVAVREKVVQVEVEKVIKVKEKVPAEFLGVSVGGGVVTPQWGGTPAAAAELEIRLSLPFADRMFAVAFSAGGHLQQMKVNAADPNGAQLALESQVIAVPMLGSLVVRGVFVDIFAIYAKLGGGIYYVSGSSGTTNASRSATAWIPAARGSAGGEVAVGPGWISLEAGYIWTPITDLGGVLDGYTPGGIPATLSYRLGF